MKRVLVILALFVSCDLISQEHRLETFWLHGGFGFYNDGYGWSGELGTKVKEIRLALNYRHGDEFDLFDLAKPDVELSQWSFLVGMDRSFDQFNVYGEIGLSYLTGVVKGDLLGRDTAVFIMEEYERIRLDGVGVPIKLGLDLQLGKYVRLGVCGWYTYSEKANLFGTEVLVRLGRFE
jgi:hypothetical protein